MKQSKFVTSLAAISFGLCVTTVHAYDLPKVPGSSGSSNSNSGSTENAGDVVKNTRNSLFSFVKAKTGLLAAMGGSEQLAAQQKLLEGLKTGDAAASKDDLETLVNIDKSATDEINKKVAANAKLDSKNKEIASKSMVEYVKALLASKKLLSSIKNVAKNPMSLGANAGSVVYLAKVLPDLVTSGVSSTSTLFTYLGSNGVDLSEAKKESADLGV